MNIVLSSLCLEDGTDLQLALYYLKGYLLQGPGKIRPAPRVSIETFCDKHKEAAICRAILRHSPSVVGFSCYVWNIEKTLQVCKRLKKAGKNILIVLGGPEVSPRPSEILGGESAVDVVVRGEGEAAFAALIGARTFARPSLGNVRGISFRCEGKIIHNPDQEPIPLLNRIPSPYLAGLVDLTSKSIVDIPLETQRGCPSRCAYCYYHKQFPSMRYFPMARIEKELKLILSFRPKEVYLMDATFNACPARAKQLLKLFIRHNRGSQLHVELKAELVDEELAGLLRRAKAFNIEIGIQSTNLQTLKAVNRGFDAVKFARGIGLLNKHGLLYEIQLLDALPYQGYHDIKKSLDWLYALRPAKVIILRLSLLPGTELRQKAGDFGIRFETDPPYHAQSSQAITPAGLLRVENLRLAMQRLYDNRIFRDALYSVQSQAGIAITQIFEDWIRWIGRLKRTGILSPYAMDRRLPQFLDSLCRGYACTALFQKLIPGLRRNLKCSAIPASGKGL